MLAYLALSVRVDRYLSRLIECPDGTSDYAPGAEDCIPPDGCVIVYGPEDQISRLCDQLRCEFDPTEVMKNEE